MDSTETVEHKSTEKECINIAVVGEVDAAKSTFIGVISSGALDNGRGLARQSVLSCKHELETGRTSNINTVVVRFNIVSGDELRSSPESPEAPSNEPEDSPKVAPSLEGRSPSNEALRVRFLDLAGHEKYLNTTLQGLTRYKPDLALLLIAGNRGMTTMAQEHFRVCFSLRIPIVICVSKLDITPPDVLSETIRSIQKLVGSVKPTKIHAYPIKSEDTLARAIKAFNMSPYRVCPIARFSNVTGDGLDWIKTFLSKLDFDLVPDTSLNDFMDANSIKQLFWTYKPYHVAGIGSIVFGVNQGAPIAKGAKLFIGPISDGYREVRVRSIHSMDRELIDVLPTGASGCLALRFITDPPTKRQMRKTIVTDKPVASDGMIAEVYIFSHHSTITVGYNPFIHFANAATSARVAAMCDPSGTKVDVMRTNDRGRITFMFPSKQFAYPGSLIIFREGGLRGVGRIISLV